MTNSETTTNNAEAANEKSVTHVIQYPTQAFVDKVGKNKAFAVMASSIDYDNKIIHYLVAKDDTRSATVDIPMDEACKMFGWDSFTFSEDKSLIYPVIDGYEPPDPHEDYKRIDEHFLEPGYNWMSAPRLTTPMNNSMEGIAEINAQLHQHNGVYYGKFSHPITDDFLDGLVLANNEPNNQAADY